MRKLIFNMANKAILELVQKSIKDQALLAFVLVLITHMTAIVDLLTDDDKDNTAQVRQYLKEHLDDLIFSLVEFSKNFKKNQL
jgi:hypothetical protein